LDHRSWLDEKQGATPAFPKTGNKSPEPTITLAHDQPSTWALIDRKLMPKGSDLKMKRKAGTKPAYQHGNGKGDEIFHGRKPWNRVLKNSIISIDRVFRNSQPSITTKINGLGRFLPLILLRETKSAPLNRMVLEHNSLDE
jgi:hypothetical protein